MSPRIARTAGSSRVWQTQLLQPCVEHRLLDPRRRCSSGLSRSCTIRRSWVSYLFYVLNLPLLYSGCLFGFFYTILIVNVCLQHILSLYNAYAIIHTVYIFFFFFLCDAAIYLLNYYSNVWDNTCLFRFMPSPPH